MLSKSDKKLVSSKIITFPEPNCIYEFKVLGYSFTFSFEGSILSRVECIDVSSLTYRLFNGEIKQIKAFNGKFSFESKETLPLGIGDARIPLFVHHTNDSKLHAVLNLHMNLDTNSYSLTSCGINSEQEVEVVNNILQQECQALAGDIPIQVGEHPIYKVENRPGLEVLNSVYDEFWNYNKDKLSEQYSISRGSCHIRAHFITTLLSHYGIESEKIFQVWNNEDWKAFADNKSWGFHCAVLLTDNENNKWVWDPWVGLNPQLLSLPEWLNAKDAPKPIKAVIANRGVIHDFMEGTDASLSFENGASAAYRNVFQALYGSAIPNPPERMLPSCMESLSFFNSSKKRRNLMSQSDSQLCLPSEETAEEGFETTASVVTKRLC